tara:strand:- start:150 stop:737 length:588 start_codon:yes stop_codon:yes gene_type:complete
MGLFSKGKLKYRRFQYFEERAFNRVCHNVQKIIKQDFTFDLKHRQDRYSDFFGELTTETIFYEYLVKNKKRIGIMFEKCFISNEKDLEKFCYLSLPVCLNENEFKTPIKHFPFRIFKHFKKNYKYPSSYLFINDISNAHEDYLDTRKGSLIKYEYDRQSEKIQIDTHVTKKCNKLIEKITTVTIKKIFNTKEKHK